MLLQVAEFMSEESGASFWRFLGAVGATPQGDAAAGEGPGAGEDGGEDREEPAGGFLASLEAGNYSEALHEQVAAFALARAAPLLSPLKQATLRLTLAVNQHLCLPKDDLPPTPPPPPPRLQPLRLCGQVRSFAPLVEAHRSLALKSSGVCADHHSATSRVIAWTGLELWWCSVAGSSSSSSSPSLTTPPTPSSSTRRHTQAWVVMHPAQRVLCTPQDLITYLSQASPTDGQAEAGLPSPFPEALVPELDHRFPQSAAPPAPGQDRFLPVGAAGHAEQTAILYARIGSSAFAAFHEVLNEAALRGLVGAYVLRHGVPPGSATTSTTLQGYGVNLDIKNMEYKNLDDGAGANAAAAAGAEEGSAEGARGEKEAEDAAIEFEEGEDVEGFLFATLHQRKPELGPQLKTLRRSLLEEAQASDSSEMKIWKMQDLGLQAVTSILSSKDPLRRLVDVAQDFPLHANSLSSIQVCTRSLACGWGKGQGGRGGGGGGREGGWRRGAGACCNMVGGSRCRFCLVGALADSPSLVLEKHTVSPEPFRPRLAVVNMAASGPHGPAPGSQVQPPVPVSAERILRRQWLAALRERSGRGCGAQHVQPLFAAAHHPQRSAGAGAAGRAQAA